MGEPVHDGPLELRARADGPDRRRRGPLVLAVVGALALVAAVVVLRRDDGVDVAVEESTTTTAPAPDVEDRSFPTPIALGGPTDGKESIGLPVKAEPATGLVDGQEVLVTGTGFPPGVDVGVVMCTKEAGRDHGARGVEACNIGHFRSGTTDAAGEVTVPFAVRRLVVVDGQEVDCASEPGRCLIGMGMLSDYDTSGGVLVDFDATEPLPPPPTASVVPSADLVDGESVLVEVTGLVPGSGVGAALCTLDGSGCVDLPVDAVADADGSVAFSARAWRAFAIPSYQVTPAVNADCALVPCQLQVWGQAPGDRTIPAVGLGFAGGELGRTQPEIEVLSEGPYRPGDVIELVLAAPASAGIEPVLCSAETCAGGLFDVREEAGGYRIALTVPGREEGNPCAGGPCYVVVHLWPTPHPDEPPPLAPDPVPVEITG